MTLFTKNPLERLMMQRPYPGKEETPRTPAPEGHFCYGCSRYGTVCLRPCYRDTDLHRCVWSRPARRLWTGRRRAFPRSLIYVASYSFFSFSA